MESSPIFIKTYDLLVWMSNALTKFPKSQRFRLAMRIEDHLFEFHSLILMAGHMHQPKSCLDKADQILEKLRIYLRLAKDTRCMAFDQYAHASQLVNELGKLLGGWLKAI